MSGYWADIDDLDDKPIIEEDELNMAAWFKKEEIDIDNDGISLTREMIEYFKNGRKIDL